MAAIAAGFLPMIDAEEMYLWGCAETRRLNDFFGGVHVGLLALVTVAAIVTGHDGGAVRFLLRGMATFGVALAFLIVGLHDGPGHVAGVWTHGTLLVLLFARWIRSRVRTLTVATHVSRGGGAAP
ncbi:MAG TPA: hypothetical protein VM261_23750 [Kofleriaceae bacterium]|nr:hypothetical protein [Kofleriaceae bacterium]